MVVVNTEDAVYISSKKSADNIKEIIKDNLDQYETYFDYNRISYREWVYTSFLIILMVIRLRRLQYFQE